MQLDRILNSYQLTRNFKLKNRIVLAPLNIQSALFDGKVSLNDLDFHSKRSKDVGMDVVGSAYVSESGNTAFGSISAAKDEDIPGLRRLSETIHQNGCKAILQLVHAGRMTNQFVTKGHPVVGPSPIKAEHGVVDTPTELTNDIIKQVIDDFVSATNRAIQAGFDGVELHGANTFLLQQFMSPCSNQRHDQFGGSIMNRVKFPLLVAHEVARAAHTETFHPFVVGYRLSPEEVETGGLTFTDNLVLMSLLKQVGIDYLGLSLRWYNQHSVTNQQLGRFSVAEVVRQVVGELPMIVSGQLNDPAHLREAGGDLFAVGKQLFVKPDWAKTLNKGYSEAELFKLMKLPYSG